MRVRGNVAQINFGVEVVDDTVLEANRAASATMQAALQTLAELGIPDVDVRPYSYNVYAERYYPDYERDDPGTVPLFPEPGEEVRYRVMHQVAVIIRQMETLPDVVEALVAAGGNALYIYGTDYQYDDPASLEDESRRKAIADAERKANEIAQRIGMELGPVVAISELVQGSYTQWDFLEGSIWPGQLQFYKQLQIEYAVIPPTGPGDMITATPTPALPVESTPPPFTPFSVEPPATPDAVGTPVATAVITQTNAVSSTAPLMAPAATDHVSIVGGDEATLREFLRQFFVQTFGPVEPSDTTVYIAALPPNLPYTLELPAGIHVAGSVVTGGEFANTQILFTVDENSKVAESLVALRQQLEAQGYTPLADQRNPGAFVIEAQDYFPMCSPDNRTLITLSGRGVDDGTGVLRIYNNPVADFDGTCGASPGPSPDAFSHLLPNLSAPVPIAVFSSGGGSDGNGFDSTFRFDAETTVAALAAHYNAQLLARNWQLLGASQTEHMAWSGWSLQDGDQRFIATLTVVRDAKRSNRFLTTLRLDRDLLTPE
jgi:uncharacterized protein YggE